MNRTNTDSSLDIRQILGNWELGNIISIKRLETGVVNENWLVKSSQGRFVFRKMSFARRKDMNLELDYLDHLKSMHFSIGTPSYLRTKELQRFILVNGSTCWLYRYINGNFERKLGQNEIRQVAKMLANYHKLISTSAPNNGVHRNDDLSKGAITVELQTFLSKLTKKRKLTRTDQIFLREARKLIPLLEEEIANEETIARLAKYHLHRDITPTNLIWRGKKLVGLVDFENVSRYNDPLMKDIGVFFQHGCRIDSRLNLRHAKLFLNEYQKHFQISEHEVNLIPIIAMVGYVEDFSYEYWMLKNGSKRARLTALQLYSKCAQWYHSNRNLIAQELQNR